MQFSAPIPGSTGPIRLSQKTIVQTPGPIVQYMRRNVDSSETTSSGTTRGSPSPVTGPISLAITGQLSTPSGTLLTPLLISQRISTKPGMPAIKQEPSDKAEGLKKQSDNKVQFLEQGETTCYQKSQTEKDAECYTPLLPTYIQEPKEKANDNALEEDKIGIEITLKSSTEMLKEQESPVKKSEMEVPEGKEPKVKQRMRKGYTFTYRQTQEVGTLEHKRNTE
ncbi:testis-expressed basic protein 1-like [Thomomys bottae]